MGLHCVTGAFGYSGSCLARDLIAAGHGVRTLTNSPRPEHPLWGQVDVHPLDFQDAAGLRRALEGVDVLYNTYWVRFSKAGFSQADAVLNTEALFDAARDAGVGRVVHTSITNPSIDSPYPYFRGKARLEASLRASGVPFTILRPAVFFGGADILVNNIAWMLRRFPFFGVFGRGDYHVRAIHVEDFARLALAAGGRDGDECVDAVGPEAWSYRELARTIGRAIGVERRIVSLPAWLGLAVAWGVGRVVGDVVLTRNEVHALMDDLLTTEGPATGPTRLSAWAAEHAETLGRTYANEVARRQRRHASPKSWRQACSS